MHDLNKILDRIERRKAAILNKQARRGEHRGRTFGKPTPSAMMRWAESLHMGESKYNRATREDTFFARDEHGDIRLYWKKTRTLVRPSIRTTTQKKAA